MKKVIALILGLSMALFVLSGCSLLGAASVKTGLAVSSSIAKSADAGEKDGLAEVDSTIAAVTVDKDGKIVKCVIDVAQTKVNFSKEGKLLTALDKEFMTKQELKADYGMAKASAIKKEWNEQADALAAYVVGKTAEEVMGIAINDEGVAADAELASSVTVHLADLLAIIEKAVKNAVDIGAKEDDKLGLGVETTIAKSKDAGDADGVAQAYSYYTASTFDAKGKITSAIIDASISNVNFDKMGKVTSDLTAALQTKNEIGDGYGMKKASAIGKEWDEQAAAFAKYVTGKTVEEVNGIALSDEGVPTVTELTSSVTVHISSFQNVIEKASVTAK